MAVSLPYNHCKRCFTICIEGNIGSGKTTFLQHFNTFHNTEVIAEPIGQWRNVAGANLLELMYTNPHRWACHFQSYVQLTMLKLHTRKTNKDFKVMERSFYSGRCFVENMRRHNLLEPVEYYVLEEWYKTLAKKVCIETDLIVYLRTSPEVAYERIRSRGRKEEECVTLEFLRDIHAIHEEWLYNSTLFDVTTQVLTIDANQDLDGMVREFENCKREVYRRYLQERGKTLKHVFLDQTANCAE